jgi:hypothetical protein
MEQNVPPWDEIHWTVGDKVLEEPEAREKGLSREVTASEPSRAGAEL